MAKGIIRNIPLKYTHDRLMHALVNARNPSLAYAKRLGSTTTVILLYEGNRVLMWAYFNSIMIKVSLYRKQIDFCKECRRLGHRPDVCPRPTDKLCPACGAKNSTRDHEYTPKCKLCGDAHHTADRTCRAKFKTPYFVKQRRWAAKRNEGELQREADSPDQYTWGSSNTQPACEPTSRSRSRSKSRLGAWGYVAWGQGPETDPGPGAAEIHLEGKDARSDNEAARRTEDARQAAKILNRKAEDFQNGKIVPKYLKWILEHMGELNIEDTTIPQNLNEKAHQTVRELTYHGSESDGLALAPTTEGGTTPVEVMGMMEVMTIMNMRCKTTKTNWSQLVAVWPPRPTTLSRPSRGKIPEARGFALGFTRACDRFSESTPTGKRPHQCHHCSKAFRHMSHLTRHIRIHTGERPFECHICAMRFNQKNSLTRHLETHTGRNT
ncbi:hypothetical protein HPB51_000205 [Rhipicephalus microplus]|uniref:C2H2-type domain-containing protein n=1 Tax=Rhipicephalus microplus TaxID=6941 RepID=A0A9J6E4V5_RHIMP|nr:hypothetical protein HPB51_000205 [Rhipicephalus microplus]